MSHLIIYMRIHGLGEPDWKLLMVGMSDYPETSKIKDVLVVLSYDIDLQHRISPTLVYK